jgi:single-strand DNA-binding protein
MPSATFQIEGNLTRDPELRYSQNGTAVAKLGVAVTKKVPGRDGAPGTEKAHFFDVTLFGRGAEGAGTLKKGAAVMLRGDMEMDTWDDKDTGKKRTAISLKSYVACLQVWPPKDGAAAPRASAPQRPATTAPAADDSDVPF